MLKSGSIDRLTAAINDKRRAEHLKREAESDIAASTAGVIHDVRAKLAEIDTKTKDAFLALFIARDLGCPNLRKAIIERMNAL